MGNVTFGNRLVPTTLSCHIESASGLYTTAKAACAIVLFQHVLRVKGKQLVVVKQCWI
eukprot:m.192137 g.192137  ORF g.192137 m.192137 type:complete len:58 (+) comp39465_c0_seq8:596-769(+)